MWNFLVDFASIFIYLFLSYLLSSYYGPSIFLGAVDIAVTKTLKQNKIKQKECDS